METGEKIRRRREDLGMSQDELAKRCGYASRVSISKIESCERRVPSNKIELFARTLNVLPEYLMGWAEDDGVTISDEDLVSVSLSRDKELYAIFARATKDKSYRAKLIKITELLE